MPEGKQPPSIEDLMYPHKPDLRSEEDKIQNSIESLNRFVDMR